MSLLRNNGDGTFTDVTEAAGLLAHLAPTQTAVWVDYDGDGWLDLFVGNESRSRTSSPTDANPCELYHNNGDGTFTNVAHESGVDVVGFVKGVVSGDYDNDGRPGPLPLAAGRRQHPLPQRRARRRHGRGWRFTDVTARGGRRRAADAASHLVLRLRQRRLAGPLRRRLRRLLGSTVAADVAADYLGLDLARESGRASTTTTATAPSRTSRKAAGLDKVLLTMGRTSATSTTTAGSTSTSAPGTRTSAPSCPTGCSATPTAAASRTSRPPATSATSRRATRSPSATSTTTATRTSSRRWAAPSSRDKAYSALYREPGQREPLADARARGRAVQPRARSARASRSRSTTPRTGRRVLYRTVGSGGSFGGSPLRQEIGLGDAQRIASVEVFWPATGLTQTVRGLKLDHRYRIREGSETAEPIAPVGSKHAPAVGRAR